MGDYSGYSRGVKVAILCTIWFCLSSSNNVIIKRLLSDYPYPITVSLSHMTSTAFLMYPVLFGFGVKTTVDIPILRFYVLLIPLGIGKLLVSISSHVSIWRIPVSYAHTVKAMMPIFTVLITRMIFKERQSWKVYLSLLPIISGVGIATVTELSFEVYGMLTALFCTMVFALQNIYTKRAIKDLRLNHLHLLTRIAHISFVIAVPLWLITDSQQLFNDERLASSDTLVWFLSRLVLSGIINFTQNIMAFSVLNLLSPLSYSVATATKRILVIAISILTLKNPITPMNSVGMFLAVFGVFLYNRTKQIEVQKRLATLPFTYTKTEKTNQNGFTNVHKRPHSFI
ncbi:solute carrier family 35 member E1 homolog [Rhopilema esculentum]|uniref:solute carrier family 35 member E1 homolog n=1 Tax=Rhopilema esculentum TaxID=499914 RepID=UPI0031CE9694